MNYLDFEKPLAEIEGKAEELRSLARTNPQMDVGREAEALAMEQAGWKVARRGERLALSEPCAAR